MTEISDALLIHRSPGITAMYNELKTGGQTRVLDLGSSSASSFNFFSQLGGKIHFENLDDLFVDADMHLLDSEQRCTQLNNYLTQFAEDVQFDAILAWDLLDYLDLTTIEWLINRLSKHLRPNAILHSIKCVSNSIPETPRHFQIKDQYHVILRQGALVNRRIACHATTHLQRHMANFVAENSYLNFAGMIPGLAEQLMRFQPTTKRTARRQSSDELAKSDDFQNLAHTTSALPHRSNALGKLLQPFTDRTDINILDLGLKNRTNYDFLFDITHGVFAENIYHDIQVQLKSGANPTIKSHMFNFGSETRFDAILTWDILNFLPLEFITELFSHLTPFTHENTQLHSIIYSGRETPSQPQQFELIDTRNIRVTTTEKRPSLTPLTSTSLLRAIGSFHLAETFIFQEGMQRGVYEYLFVRQKNRSH